MKHQGCCWIWRNYLRVRGEYLAPATPQHGYPELPPRARRILETAVDTAQKRGTTSACAENTLNRPGRLEITGNYLRVRGEYLDELGRSNHPVELPPRARRIHFCGEDSAGPGGTTSACAENTPNAPQQATDQGNYLRVRGEYGRRR